MDQDLLNELHTKGIISEQSLEKTQQRKAENLFSVHLEVKLALYLSILMLTTGLGILVYKNIDTIGHQAILAFIAIITIGSFIYCFKNQRPFSTGKVESPTPLFDFVLLLGTLTLLIFVGYLQYEYNVFGSNYGMATFVPMVALFYIAYNFDHIGILNLAITNLGLWMGVSVTPKQLLMDGTFNSDTIIYAYLVFAAILLGFTLLTHRLKIKTHFKFSYMHYGVHVCFISLLAGFFHFYDNQASVIWLLVVFAIGYVVYRDALKQHSFYFLLLAVLYSYVALSSLVIKLLDHGMDSIYLIFMYFIASSIGTVVYLINLAKKIKAV